MEQVLVVLAVLGALILAVWLIRGGVEFGQAAADRMDALFPVVREPSR